MFSTMRLMLMSDNSLLLLDTLRLLSRAELCTLELVNRRFRHLIAAYTPHILRQLHIGLHVTVNFNYEHGIFTANKLTVERDWRKESIAEVGATPGGRIPSASSLCSPVWLTWTGLTVGDDLPVGRELVTFLNEFRRQVAGVLCAISYESWKKDKKLAQGML